MPASLSENAKELRTATHKTIDGVGKDIDAFHMNKAVARIREFSNALASFQTKENGDDWALREGYEALIRLMNPMIPHLAEELWAALGHETLLADESWPKADPALLKTDSITIAVQINGKVKSTITLPSDAGKDEAEKTALAEDAVQKALEGKTIRKIIVVPGRIVNVVAG